MVVALLRGFARLFRQRELLQGTFVEQVAVPVAGFPYLEWPGSPTLISAKNALNTSSKVQFRAGP